MYGAIAGTQDCLRGRKFVGDIEHRTALALVARRQAGKPVAMTALEEAAGAGDTEAQMYLGIRRESQQAGSGRDLLTAAAQGNVGLAIVALAYWDGGLDRPARDRAAAFCWMNAALRSADSDIRMFAERHLPLLEKRMSEADRNEGTKRWALVTQNLAHPSCQ
jgi:hypothetical protein